MDLNENPNRAFNVRSELTVKIIVRRKIANREVLIQKYGEEAYNTIVASPDALILYGDNPRGTLCIYVLV